MDWSTFELLMVFSLERHVHSYIHVILWDFVFHMQAIMLALMKSNPNKILLERSMLSVSMHSVLHDICITKLLCCTNNQG